MSHLKKYNRFYFTLVVIIFVAFAFIFRNIFILRNENNLSINELADNLYLLNSVVLISIVSFLIALFFMVRKFKKNIRELSENHTEIIHEKTKGDFAELENKEIIEKLSALENSISIEKTNEKKLEVFLKYLVKQTESVQAALFLTVEKENNKILKFVSGYAFYVPEDNPIEFHFGEGLSGQVAVDQKLLKINDIKVDRLPVYSGMGSSVPQHLIICPLLFDNETLGIIELASFRNFELKDELFIEKAALLLSGFLKKTE